MKNERSFSMTIRGDIANGGRVPVALLSDKLRAAQRLFYGVGSAILGGGGRGTYKSAVTEHCALVLESASPGSLTLEMSLPEPARRALTDMDGHDLGMTTLQAVDSTLAAISGGDRRDVERKFPDRARRNRVMSAALELLPEKDSGYTVEFAFSSGGRELREDHREFVASIASEREGSRFEDDLVTVTGKLYLIEIETGERRVGLKIGNRRVICYYQDHFEDAVREIVPGSVVEVQGMPDLDERGSLIQVHDIVDIRQVKVGPQYMKKVRHGGRELVFKEPIQVEVSYQDRLWVYEYEPFGIMAYDETRREALDAFKMEMDALWEHIAGEKDDLLTPLALRIKRDMLAMVETAETS